MMMQQMNIYLSRTLYVVSNVILLLLLVRFFIIGIGIVDGHSMEPTLHDGQLFFVNKLVYLIHEPRINDIVQAYRPDNSQELIVKRVAGTPAPYTYFLVGDNADTSTDSRTFGPVPRQLIKGKVVQ